MMPAFHMLGLRDSLRTYRFGMAQDLVVNLVLIQTIDESFWYFHTASETNYHFPGVSLLCPSPVPYAKNRIQRRGFCSQKSIDHRHEVHGARNIYAWLHAKFAKTNMTRRLRWSLPASITRSTASSARSTRWRRFVRIATAESSDMAWRQSGRSSAASTAPAVRVKRN